jgi:CCR4-NOT transcriptional regulation complex NOT5 subunit
MGMDDSSQIETASLRISVWTVTDLICDIKSTVAEEHTYLTGTDKYTLTNLPTSNISLVTGTLSSTPAHTFVKDTDYQLIDDDSDGFYDAIEWLGEDEPDDSTTIYISYQRKGAGDELCRFIAQEINEYLRDNWRDWTERIVWGYKKTGGTPIDFDSEIGVWRYELTVSFEGINIGDSI